MHVLEKRILPRSVAPNTIASVLQSAIGGVLQSHDPSATPAATVEFDDAANDSFAAIAVVVVIIASNDRVSSVIECLKIYDVTKYGAKHGD